jgi:hypothetical protein
MSYIGNQPTQIAFLTDSFSGNASTTVFTMSVAPANTASVLVAIFGVLQDPSTYSVVGTSLTFSAAPPSGTGNISVRYLGIPASGVTTTAYRTVTEFTATSGQVTFTPPSYTPGFIAVYRNGVMLGSADITATNGTTVTLTTGATSGDLVTTESFYVSSVLNAIPNIANAVTDSLINSVSASKLTGSQTIPKATLPAGSVLQVVQATAGTAVAVSSTSFVTAGLSASITPTSSTSKILVFANACVYGNQTSCQPVYTIYRNSTNLGDSGRGFGQVYSGAGAVQAMGTMQYLDSPATTSSTTYTVYMKVNLGTGYWGGDNGTQVMTLMEIAA